MQEVKGNPQLLNDRRIGSYFRNHIQKVLDNECEAESDLENSDEDDQSIDKRPNKNKDHREITQNELNKISSVMDDPNVALLYSTEKYHEHLLNCMNIRADPALTEHFSKFLSFNDSEKTSNGKEESMINDDNQSYQESEENEMTSNQDDTVNKDMKSNKSEKADNTISNKDYQEYEEDRNQSYDNGTEKSRDDKQSYDRSDAQFHEKDIKKADKIFVNPFENLPKRSIEANHYSNNVRLSLATLVMNNQVQKLFEENRRLKAKFYIMDKQMKTSDPFKKWKYQQQIDQLDKPGSLDSYKLFNSYPFTDGIAYQSDANKYEEWKNSKKNGVDESEDIKNPLGEYANLPPDLMHRKLLKHFKQLTKFSYRNIQYQ